MDTEMRALLLALQAMRLPLIKEERTLHDEIAKALMSRSISFQREAKLGPYARVDFLCGSIAVEAKKGKPNRRLLLEQLSRYAQSPLVTALVLVTERSSNLPETVLGKPLHLVNLNRLWGVAL